MPVKTYGILLPFVGVLQQPARSVLRRPWFLRGRFSSLGKAFSMSLLDKTGQSCQEEESASNAGENLVGTGGQETPAGEGGRNPVE